MDSLRYRLEENDDYGDAKLEQVGTLDVPEENFMDECNLGADAFSPVKMIEVAVGQIGYQIGSLNRIADCMKEEPLRQAAKVLYSEYQTDDSIPLLSLIEKVLEEWCETQLTPLRDPGFIVRHVPTRGADYVGTRIDGRYKHVGKHNNRPKYQHAECSTTIVYFSERWKMNWVDDVTRFCFSHQPKDGDTARKTVPSGEWVAEPSEVDPKKPSDENDTPDGGDAAPALDAPPPDTPKPDDDDLLPRVIKDYQAFTLQHAVKEDAEEFPIVIANLFADAAYEMGGKGKGIRFIEADDEEEGEGEGKGKGKMKGKGKGKGKNPTNEVIESLLRHVRGCQERVLELRQAACASLWRVITNGA